MASREAQAALSNDTRRLIRQIIRQVHPDLFAANPYERQCNSDSLQVGCLNGVAARPERSPAGVLCLTACLLRLMNGFAATSGAERIRR
jgi:hypothetical protein